MNDSDESRDVELYAGIVSANRYRILRKLGAGGMGEVYLAEDSRLRRKIALKVLPETLAADRERLLRFEQEAFAASALNHPNILTIYEFGADGATHFLASEFVAGETLRERLKQNDLTFLETLDISLQIVSALQAAHSAGIVHRDIKPENLMIRTDGIVKVLDFGLAKLVENAPLDEEAETRMQVETQAGTVMGTAAYMSPEQARGRRVDARTDIFSFGVVLYEMLTHRQPFTGETVNHTIVAILEKEPPSLSHFIKGYPVEIERIIKKCLAKKVEERYPLAKDLLDDLKELKEELAFQSKLERSASPDKNAEAETQIISAVTTAEEETLNSIAILPFANLSNDAENEYFCDGLAEEFLNALAKIEDLRVAARTSAFSFKNKNIEVSEIGKALNVRTILEGSVRKSGDKLRITVQLINAANGYHLWSERYDRAMQDIFDVQDEITLAVVDALKVKLFGDEKAAVLKRYTDNAEAYELYLKGLYHFNKWTTDGLRRSLDYFEQATGKEPEFAPAYAKIADYYGFLSHVGLFSPREIFPKWKAAADRALETDDRLADAHLAIAHIYFFYERNWKLAEREFARAVELNPNDSYAHRNYGLFLVSTGKFDRAFSESKKALELDPLSPSLNLVVGFIYLFAGRLDDAQEQLRRLNELEHNSHGTYWFDGELLLANGKYEEAIAKFQKALALIENQLTLSKLGYTYGLAGRRDEALNILNQLFDLREQQYAAAFNIARVYAGLGDNDKTFEWLEKALEERNGELAHSSPFIKAAAGIYWGESFRADPRYQDILRRIGFSADENAQEQMTNETSENSTQIFDSAEAPRGDVSKSPAPATSESNAQNDDTQLINPASDDTPHHSTSSAEYIAREVKKYKRGFAAAVLALLIASFAGFGWWFYANRAINTKQIESIAVLPFENASGNADLDYLSDGVSESVIDRLSQLPQLKVIARSSSFQYRGQNLKLQEIANALGVDAIVTGRVVQRGDSYQIRIEMINGRENRNLWSETFSRKASDIQILQTDISREIAENLRLKLSGTQTQQLTKQPTNQQAYELVLKGIFYRNKGGRENGKKAIEFFQQAVAIDPNYAPAYAGLADSYRNLSGDPKESMPKREAAIRRALELDETLAEAHFSMGQYQRDLWNWQEAERAYRRAMEVNPNYAHAYSGLSGLLSLLGRHDEAIAADKRATELDPVGIIINTVAGRTLYFARRYDEAIEQLKKTIELDRSSPTGRIVLANIYATKGMHAEAVAEYQLAIKLGAEGNEIQIRLGAAYAKMVERERALEILKHLQTSAGYVSPGQLAILYTALGETEQAFATLEKAYAERSPSLQFLKANPEFDSLRSDPRYADLLRRMNLQQQ